MVSSGPHRLLLELGLSLQADLQGLDTLALISHM